jgi:acetyltransferase
VRPHSFERVFAPRAIAVFGGDDPSAAGCVLETIVAGGFEGPVYAVGGHAVASGVRNLGSLREAEGPVDLAVVATPASDVREVLRACGERGVAGAVIPTALASEPGLALDLRDAGARHGVRLIGPNSVGFIRPSAKVNATSGGVNARPGSLALLSQSGAICTAVLDWAAARSPGAAA